MRGEFKNSKQHTHDKSTTQKEGLCLLVVIVSDEDAIFTSVYLLYVIRLFQ